MLKFNILMSNFTSANRSECRSGLNNPLEIVVNSYNQGNQCFLDGRYEEALQHYGSALAHCNVDNELYLRLLLNRGHCYSKVNQPAAAVEDFNKVIGRCGGFSPSCGNFLIKAHMRRSQCYEQLGYYERALVDAEKTLTFPNLPPKISRIVLQSRRRLREFVGIDGAVSKREGTPTKMVTKAQMLRLFFKQQPPDRVGEGESFIVKLCIANELGLWDRELMANTNSGSGDPPVELNCELKTLQLQEQQHLVADHSSSCNSSSSSSSSSQWQVVRDGSGLKPSQLGSDGRVSAA